jgi:hypothetical protein
VRGARACDQETKKAISLQKKKKKKKNHKVKKKAHPQTHQKMGSNSPLLTSTTSPKYNSKPCEPSKTGKNGEKRALLAPNPANHAANYPSNHKNNDKPRVYRRRWAMLAIFALLNGFCSVIQMTAAGVQNVALAWVAVWEKI